jgi:hypothetical protein
MMIYIYIFVIYVYFIYIFIYMISYMWYNGFQILDNMQWTTVIVEKRVICCPRRKFIESSTERRNPNNLEIHWVQKQNLEFREPRWLEFVGHSMRREENPWNFWKVPYTFRWILPCTCVRSHPRLGVGGGKELQMIVGAHKELGVVH